MDEKAEWEQLLDDSYQWRIGEAVVLALSIVCFVLGFIADPWWWVAEALFSALYWAFRLRENHMVSKAVQLRLKEREDDTEA